MDIEREITSIQERNARVELSKAWEVSFTRRAFIVLITYCVALLFLWVINVPTPYLAALVPAGGYILSTLSLPFLRDWWMARK